MTPGEEMNVIEDRKERILKMLSQENDPMECSNLLKCFEQLQVKWNKALDRMVKEEKDSDWWKNK